MEASWLNGVYSTFARALGEGRLPGSVLLIGTPGIGVYELAAACVSLCLCRSPAAGQACGSCRPCRLLSGLGHPDFAALLPSSTPGNPSPARSAAGAPASAASPEDDGSSPAAAAGGTFRHTLAAVRALDGGPGTAQWSTDGSHRLDTLRQLHAYLHESAVISSRRVVLIAAAHLLQASGANALLKLFEEPPPRTLIILVASSPELLLPTILSRAFRLTACCTASQPAVDFIQRRTELSGERAAQALALALNEPYSALELITTDQDLIATRCIQQLGTLTASYTASALETALAGLLELASPWRMRILWLAIIEALKYRSGFPPESLPLVGSCPDHKAHPLAAAISSLAAPPRSRLLHVLDELCRLRAEAHGSTLPLKADACQLRSLLEVLAGTQDTAPPQPRVPA